MSKAQASVTGQAQGARRREALGLGLVRNHVIGAMAVGVLPLPLLDIALLTALQLRMIARLCKFYRIPFSRNRAEAVIASLLGGILSAAAPRWGWALLKLIPLPGFIPGAIGSMTMAAATTYAVGRVFLRHFEHGRSFSTLRVEDIRQEVRSFLHEGGDVASEPPHGTTPAVAEEPPVEGGPTIEPLPPARDDLTRLDGIGPKISELLQQRGITTFTQLAETDVDRLRQILHEANLRMLDPRTWPEQARAAEAGNRESPGVAARAGSEP
ncbi:MAG: DUF4332 domain-containing protein [bacterium]